MRCLIRRLTAWTCLGTLLFLQLAVAAYACAPSAGSFETIAIPAVAAQPPCHAPDPGAGKLCEQHCVQDSRTADSSGVIVAPAAPPRLDAWIAVATAALPVAVSPHHLAYPLAVDPPPHVRFGVLRL
ncbi:MAG: hypothetical protein ABI920_02330 [Casimicrobiaceae bacterium]